MEALFIILAILQVDLFFYTTGFNLEKLAKWHFLEPYPFLIKTTIRTCLGLAVLVPVLYAVSLVSVSLEAFLSVFVANLIGTVVLSSSLWNTIPSLGRRIFQSATNTVGLVIGVATTALFARSVSTAQWPSVGDITWVHGPMVSLISYYGRLPSSWFPITNLPLHYPAGFHVVPAFFNTLWNVYPAQVVFIYGASLVPLLTLLIYSLTWLASDSNLASLAGALSVLYIMPDDLHLWTVGYFYSGPYPNLVAFLLVGLFATVLLIEDRPHLGPAKISHLVALGVLCSLSLLLLYPPFLVFTAVGTLASLGMVRGTVASTLRQRGSILRIAIGVGVLASAVVFLRPTWSAGWTLSYLIANPSHYALPLKSLVLTWFGLSVIIGVAVSVLHFGVGTLRRFSIQYLLVAVPGLLFYVMPFFLVILPNRALSLAFLIAPVLILSVSKHFPRTFATRSLRIRRSRLKLGIHVVPMLILVLCIPSIQMYASGGADKQWLWFSRTTSFPDDFRAMRWIADNIPSQDLILNDLSYASLYLPSVKVLNATFSPIAANGETGNTRLGLFEIWQNPHGYYSPEPLSFFSRWVSENQWGSGAIGRPVLSEAGGETRIMIPGGVYGQWGLLNTFSSTQNFAGFSALSVEISSNGQLGLSFGLSDWNGKIARYDLTTLGIANQTLVIALDSPNSIELGFDLTHVSSMTIRTGYASRFPNPGDELTVGVMMALRSGLVQDLLSEYGVKYLWVSAEWGMIELSSFQGIPKYVAKPFTPSQYSSIFQKYDFLRLAYSSGESTVFEVGLGAAG